MGWLIKQTAAVNARSFYGFTPLLHAAQLPRYELVALLLRSSASPNCADPMGQTPLHVTSKALQSRVVQKSNYDLSGYGDEYCYGQSTAYCNYGNHLSGTQETEQELAVKNTLSALVMCNADLEAKDNSGCSVADILELKNRADIRFWLEEIQPKRPGTQEPSDRQELRQQTRNIG